MSTCLRPLVFMQFCIDPVSHILVILVYKTNSANLYTYAQLLKHPESLAEFIVC